MTDRTGRFELCPYCTGTQVILHGRYQIGKRVGEGSFSTVYLARDLFGLPEAPPVALKIFHEQHADVGLAELRCLKDARRTDRSNAFGTLKGFGGFRHARKHIVAVTEALMGTDLFEKLTSPTTESISGPVATCPSHISQLVHSLGLALYAFHEQLHRIHADIKPENLLLHRATRRFKLIDYGSSVPLSSLGAYFCEFELGSFLYRAPEVLVGVPFDTGVDVWAAGCLVFEACAKRPFCASLERHEYLVAMEDVVGPLPDAFAKGRFYHDSIPVLSAFEQQDPRFWTNWRSSNLVQLIGIKDHQFLNLLSQMLDPDPATRITSRDLLAHPFLAPYVPFKPPSPAAEDRENKRPRSNSADARISALVHKMTPLQTCDEPVSHRKKKRT